MYTIGVGNVSESLVMAAYIKAGFSVSIPFGNGGAYDLIVDTRMRLLKVQVKTAWQSKGCLIYKCQRRIKDSKQNSMRPYKENEVDFLLYTFPKQAAFMLSRSVNQADLVASELLRL